MQKSCLYKLGIMNSLVDQELLIRRTSGILITAVIQKVGF